MDERLSKRLQAKEWNAFEGTSGDIHKGKLMILFFEESSTFGTLSEESSYRKLVDGYKEGDILDIKTKGKLHRNCKVAFTGTPDECKKQAVILENQLRGENNESLYEGSSSQGHEKSPPSKSTSQSFKSPSSQSCPTKKIKQTTSQSFKSPSSQNCPTKKTVPTPVRKQSVSEAPRRPSQNNAAPVRQQSVSESPRRPSQNNAGTVRQQSVAETSRRSSQDNAAATVRQQALGESSIRPSQNNTAPVRQQALDESSRRPSQNNADYASIMTYMQCEFRGVQRNLNRILQEQATTNTLLRQLNSNNTRNDTELDRSDFDCNGMNLLDIQKVKRVNKYAQHLLRELFSEDELVYGILSPGNKRHRKNELCQEKVKKIKRLIQHHYGDKVLGKGWDDIVKSMKQYCLDLGKKRRIAENEGGEQDGGEQDGGEQDGGEQDDGEQDDGEQDDGEQENENDDEFVY